MVASTCFQFTPSEVDHSRAFSSQAAHILHVPCAWCNVGRAGRRTLRWTFQWVWAEKDPPHGAFLKVETGVTTYAFCGEQIVRHFFSWTNKKQLLVNTFGESCEVIWEENELFANGGRWQRAELSRRRCLLPSFLAWGCLFTWWSQLTPRLVVTLLALC